jgi:Uncharacterized protein family UPF0004
MGMRLSTPGLGHNLQPSRRAMIATAPFPPRGGGTTTMGMLRLMIHLLAFFCRGGLLVHSFSATSSTTSSESSGTASTVTSSPPSPWFPRTIQETIPYHDRVKSLFLRHIVTETKDMGVEALRLVLSSYTASTSTSPATSTTGSDGTTSSRNATPNDDPFGSIARSISACEFTRQEGGTIGWMEPSSSSFDSTTTTIHSTSSTILPALLVQELYRRQPKAGDMELLYNDKSNQWHLIQVAEVWLDPYLSFATTTTTEEKKKNQKNTELEEPTRSVRIGSYTGSNQLLPPRKLKGKGILPTFSVNDLATYDILTAGCQMNVADSERCTLFMLCVMGVFCFHSMLSLHTASHISLPLVEGILQNQLSLTRTRRNVDGVVGGSRPPLIDTMPDVLVLNTCSIRDHAEQKLYDTLGPYAAAKRNGRQMAVIVTGCVAQQEGERLLRRIPEIDAVLGALYLFVLLLLLFFCCCCGIFLRNDFFVRFHDVSLTSIATFCVLLP